MKTKKKEKKKIIKPVFEDLGFSPSESVRLKKKADLYFLIQDLLKKRGYKPRDLKILEEVKKWD
ncbi:MAG: hypothetical protein KDD45_01390 [Bdellovibrionales bacterium]|nr:hypothetical protein [Bdellovibrionales bacterium]